MSFLNKNIPVIGIEPSAISMIRDEYIRFDSDRSDLINGKILLFDEFIVQNHRDLSKKSPKKSIGFYSMAIAIKKRSHQ